MVLTRLRSTAAIVVTALGLLGVQQQVGSSELTVSGSGDPLTTENASSPLLSGSAFDLPGAPASEFCFSCICPCNSPECHAYAVCGGGRCKASSGSNTCGGCCFECLGLF